MTTGDPLVVVGAMKPLPTLTKPLRSVDTGPRSRRRRCASAPTPAPCRPPAWWGRRWWRSCWRRLPREVRRRSHRRRAAAPSRLRGAHRVEALTQQPPAARSCFVGFMGAGKSSAARAVAAELGIEALDSDRELERELGEPIEAFFDREGESAFRAREEEVVLELLGPRPTPGVIALGGGALGSERVREALGATPSSTSRSRRGRLAARLGQGPAARPRPRALRAAARRPPGALRGRRRRALPPARARAVRRALPALQALRAAPRGHPARVGRAGVGRLPGLLRPRLLDAASSGPTDGRRFVVTDEQRGRAARRAGRPPRDRARGRGAQDARQRRGRAARAGARRGRSAATSWWRWAAAWWATWPASAPRSTSAACATCRCPPRWWPRSTPPTAARRASTSRRARTTRAPTTSRAPCCATRRARDAARRGGRRRLRGGRQDRADRGRPALGARARGGRSPTTRSCSAACARSSRWWPRTSATPAAARCSTWATPWATRSRRPPATRRYRHGEAVALGLLCALRLSGKSALRDEVAELLEARGLPLTFDRRHVDEVLALSRATRSAEGGEVPFVLVEAPGEVTPGHEVGRDALRAAIEEVLAVNNRVAVLHGVNLDALGRRDPEVYGTLTLTELEVQVRRSAHELGLEASFSQTNHEGEYCEQLHRAGERSDGLVLNPGAWTHYSYAIRDALEVAGLPAVEVHISEVDEPRGVAAAVGDPRPVRRPRAGQGRGRATARRSRCSARRCEARRRRPAGRAAAPRTSSTPARHRPDERPLPHRLHGHERRRRRQRATSGSSSPTSATSSRRPAGAGEFERLPAGRDLLGDLAPRLRGRAGFDDANMSVKAHRQLSEAVNDGVELVPAGGLVEHLREVKDEGEVAAMRAAAELADEVYEYVAERGLAGRTEREVAGGPRARDARPRRRRIPRSRRSSPPARTARCRTPSRATWRSRATRSWWSTWAARWTATARTARAPSPRASSGELATEVYDLVLNAQLAAPRRRPGGASVRDVDAAARVADRGGRPRRAVRPRAGPRRGPRGARGPAADQDRRAASCGPATR